MLRYNQQINTQIPTSQRNAEENHSKSLNLEVKMQKDVIEGLPNDETRAHLEISPKRVKNDVDLE